MPAERGDSRLREQVRGVGFVVALGIMVCVAGLAVVAAFVWALT